MYPKAREDVYGITIILTTMKYFYICPICYRNMKHVPTKNNTDLEKQAGCFVIVFIDFKELSKKNTRYSCRCCCAFVKFS